MDTGRGILSVIPLRAEPSHRSEMVSQLLFGESFIINEIKEDWWHITCHLDHYQGWVTAHQALPVSLQNEPLSTRPTVLTYEPVLRASSITRSMLLFMGSSLTLGNHKEFIYRDETYTYHGRITDDGQPENGEARLIEAAMMLLDTPYLWGGRTAAGIDCSGFVQLLYKLIGIALKRDAWMQAAQGEDVYFIYEARAGDLAFFQNDNGDIVHVGMLLNNHQIIHAHGRVRMDSIDQQGIYDNEGRKYTHHLRLIKRMLP